MRNRLQTTIQPNVTDCWKGFLLKSALRMFPDPTVYRESRFTLPLTDHESLKLLPQKLTLRSEVLLHFVGDRPLRTQSITCSIQRTLRNILHQEIKRHCPLVCCRKITFRNGHDHLECVICIPRFPDNFRGVLARYRFFLWISAQNVSRLQLLNHPSIIRQDLRRNALFRLATLFSCGRARLNLSY